MPRQLRKLLDLIPWAAVVALLALAIAATDHVDRWCNGE